MPGFAELNRFGAIRFSTNKNSKRARDQIMDSPTQEASRQRAATGDGYAQSSESLKERLGSLSESAMSHAAKAAKPVQEKARQVAKEQKGVLADGVDGFAAAIDTAAQDVSAQSPATGDMLRLAAGSIKEASQSLRDKDIDEITGAVGRFARNRPVALFAGAVVAGVALSRFLKTSSEPPKR
jgi:hypothetical protein